MLVLYYFAYGHIEAMAKAIAEAAREAGAQGACYQGRRIAEVAKKPRS